MSYVPPAGNITNTTGSYGWSPSFGETLLHAYNLCGMRPTALIQNHYESGRMAANMVLSEASGRGVNLWQVDQQCVQLAQGCATYNVPTNTITILDVYISQQQGIDRIILPISRTEYASYSNKKQQGAVTTFWFDRLLKPTITLWPVPDGTQATLKYYRLRQTQDTALTGGAVPEIPVYWWNWFTKALAKELSLMWAPTQYPVLAAEADRAYGFAADQNVEQANMYISPQMSGYYR